MAHDLQSSLCLAMEQARLDELRALLALDAHLAHAPLPTHEDITPLMFAARLDDAKAVRILAQAGADPNACGPMDVSPLILAAAWGSPHALQELLASGADIDHEDLYGEDALIAALMGRSLICAKALLDAGADPRRGTRAGLSANGLPTGTFSSAHDDEIRALVAERVRTLELRDALDAGSSRPDRSKPALAL